MAIKISGPYKGFFITVEATPAFVPRLHDARAEFAATTYIYRHAPSGDGRGIRLEAVHGRRFSSVSDAFMFGEIYAHSEIDGIES